jgi:hypothetical protein
MERFEGWKWWQWALVGLVVLTVVSALAAPEEKESSEPAPESEPTVASSERTPDGVPLPPGAERVDEDQWKVPDFSYDEVVEFYEAELPEGEDFEGWAWCDTGGLDSDTIHAHIYSKPGNRILAVAMADDETPGLNIGTDRSGPC